MNRLPGLLALTLMLLLSGCVRVEIPYSSYDVQPVPSSCSLGAYPAIFESFNYPVQRTDAAVDPGVQAQDLQGAIFGQNYWYRCRGGDLDSTLTRMWYRYNHGDVGLNERAVISYTHGGTAEATLVLEMEPGYDPATSLHHPVLMSGAQLDEGTYAARIKFSTLEDHARLMQAFWLKDAMQRGHSPANHREFDFEWNNWFGSPSAQKPRMNVTNHRAGERSVTAVLDCIYYDGSFTGTPECLQAHDDQGRPGFASYLTGEVPPGTPGREWWTLHMVVDYQKGQVTYAMRNDRYGNASGGLSAGSGTSATKWGAPVAIQQNVPGDVPLNVLLSVNFTNDASQYFTPEHPTRYLQHRHTMAVAWFYYTPVKYLSIDEVHNEVKSLTRRGYERVNTTGETLHK